MTITAFEQFRKNLFCSLGLGSALAVAFGLGILALPTPSAQAPQPHDPSAPPRVVQARRFLQQRNWSSNLSGPRSSLLRPQAMATVQSETPPTPVWQPLGPTAVSTSNYGLVTGRVSSIAIDPADVTGNHVFIGTTGGGVWSSQNAASSSNVVFTPLTDAPSAFDAYRYGSISIGAISVQPGGTGVVLAGTGDTNDALDSYYGAGILRSVDGGATWSAIPYTADKVYSFMGEGFAGFAWSTVNPQLVVAAVSQSYEGTLVNAPSRNTSYAGLYYSTDAGQNWSLARITDGAGGDIQGPEVFFALPNGNSATAVVWNPVRKIFIAAVRFHGYYQSADGITWTRMASQPGLSISARLCPFNRGTTGSIACPVFRGALAVNPQTGDTFAWTVDLYNQDQGLWQDTCGIANGSCINQSVAFAKQLNTSSLQTDTVLGPSTIANGDYNLVLAAAPYQQDTILFAGANDLWRCSLATGCGWRNTTNSKSCMSAMVAPYQHALAWNQANPELILIGNDSGLWRSMDAVNEGGSACSQDDASHFQNLNSGIGSIAEIESFAVSIDSRFTIMAGLGANGTAGIKTDAGLVNTWPQILDGHGGPVALGTDGTSAEWYANAGVGVSIYRCPQPDSCKSGITAETPAVDNADVSGDGLNMTSPAPILIDPLDPSQILVATCRLWRGIANGTGWTDANSIGPYLDGNSGGSGCSGHGLVRSLAALPLQGGGEVVYVGMFGIRNGGAMVGGHLFKATFVPGSSSPMSWRDLTSSPVVNSQFSFNYNGMDISSIFIDPHDPSGNTVYLTIAGVPDLYHPICMVYRSTDGGANWYELRSNLPGIPANGIVIDPEDADTAYLATDNGVYSTRQIGSCVAGQNFCWSVLGAGLPDAPVTQLAASSGFLTVGTYGRGIWQVPLWSQSSQLTSASVDKSSVTFPAQSVGTISSPQIITLRNTGSFPLTTSAVSISTPFSETDDCKDVQVGLGASCSIQVSFLPDSAGPVDGTLTIAANISGGQISIPLSGSGFSDSPVTASPGTLDFAEVAIGSTSNILSVTLQNAGSQSFPIRSVTATPPFKVAANPCGVSIAGNSACAIYLTFSPTQSGVASGTLTVTDDAGTQTVQLRGFGAVAATDTLSRSSISFAPTPVGQKSVAENITLSNSGDLPLNSIAISATPGFEAGNTCEGSLGPHAQCVINVVFAPSTDGFVSGVVTVSDALRTQAIALSGTALRAPVIEVSATQIAFPAQTVGQKGNQASLTITNSGGSPLANVGFQITGSGATSFSFGQSTCASSIPEGSSCSVQLAFAPASIGLLSATLTISSSTSGVAPVQVMMSGIGQGISGITITPLQMSFTQTKLGQPSETQFATILNTSAFAASELKVAVSVPFSLAQNTCGTILDPGASCSAGVVFQPAANGVVNGTLSVTSSAFKDPSIAVLVGEGGAAGVISVQPGSLAFGSAGVGISSAAKRVTLTNIGLVQLRNVELKTTPGFTIAGTTCGTSLGIANACTVDVVFAPSKAGPSEGRLSIASPSIAAPVELSLSGMGFDFTVTSAGQTSKTISSGQIAYFTLVLSPLAGSSGNFTLSCSGMPAKSSCSFNPTTQFVPANASGSVSMSVLTGGSSSTAALRKPGEKRFLPLLPVLCLIFLPVVGLSRSRAVWLVVLITCVIGTIGCAGSGGGRVSSASSNSNTPAGTYSIVVSATANGISHSTTVKLSVD